MVSVNLELIGAKQRRVGSYRRRKKVTEGSKQASMMDIIFIFATMLFFALAILYVRGCEVLGKGRPHERNSAYA